MSDVETRLLVLDLVASVSPAIRIEMVQEFDPEEEARILTVVLDAILRQRYLGAKIEYTFPIAFKVHPATDPNPKTQAQRQQERTDALDSILQAVQLAESEEEPPEELLEKDGLWLVRDMRHRALVRAFSNQEAMRKAIEMQIVSNCFLSAEFIGDPEDIDVLEL